MSFETLLFEQRDGVAHITLNREKAANALNLQMAKDLMAVALLCDEDPAVRAVLIDAKGKMFCAGGDLASFAKSGDDLPGLIKEMTTYLHAAISRFARMRAPVIGAVGGAAAGAGFSLVCAVDLLICSESAKFSMAYTGAGLAPDGSSSYYLPRLIGTRRTIELIIMNRRLSATEALDWGIVNQVVPDAELADSARKLAVRLAAGPTESYGIVKKLLLSSATESLETQMEFEARGISDSARSEDAREGIQAFFDKRKAAFSGR